MIIIKAFYIRMVEEFFHFKDELDKIAVCYGDY